MYGHIIMLACASSNLLFYTYIYTSQELVADSDRSFHRGRDGNGDGSVGGGTLIPGGGKDSEKDP